MELLPLIQRVWLSVMRKEFQAVIITDYDGSRERMAPLAEESAGILLPVINKPLLSLQVSVCVGGGAPNQLRFSFPLI